MPSKQPDDEPGDDVEIPPTRDDLLTELRSVVQRLSDPDMNRGVEGRFHCISQAIRLLAQLAEMPHERP